jgi:hypothetical protein
MKHLIRPQNKLLFAPSVGVSIGASRPGRAAGGGGGGGVPLGTIERTSLEEDRVPALGDKTIDTTSFSLAEDDLLVLNATSDNPTSLNTMVSTLVAAGWTARQHYNGDWPPSCVMTKLMGSTPDASIFLDAGSGTARIPYALYKLRGVDTTTSVDANSSLTALLTSTTLVLNSITTITNNAHILAYGGLKNDIATMTSFTAGWDSGFVTSNSQGGNNDSVLGFGWKIKTPAGLEAGPTMVFSSSDSVRGRSIAFRPKTS